MDPSQAPIKAGIVSYRRAGANFEGTWSHENIEGALAREIVYSVGAGDFLGEWSVTVFSPTGESIFSGTLKSEAFGQCLRLSWIEAGAGTADPKFVGIGRQLDPDFVVATFEPVV